MGISPRRWSLLAGFLVMGGCATQPAPDIASRWVGRPLDQFSIAHGAPQVQQKLNDGRMLAEWTDRHGVQNTGSPIQTLIGAAGNVEVQGGSYQLICRLRFVVSRSGIIEQATVATDTYGRRGTSRCAEVF